VTRAVLLVDHGSRRPAANRQLELLAQALRARLPDRVVEIAHLELEPPSIAEGIEACVAAGATRIVVHPYFLAPGAHLSRDLPRQVSEAAARHPGVEVRVSEPLGLHPKLVDVIVERLEAAADPTEG
jgi:sirohydrochlorin ferrochelatase